MIHSQDKGVCLYARVSSFKKGKRKSKWRVALDNERKTIYILTVLELNLTSPELKNYEYKIERV